MRSAVLMAEMYESTQSVNCQAPPTPAAPKTRVSVKKEHAQPAPTKSTAAPSAPASTRHRAQDAQVCELCGVSSKDLFSVSESMVDV